MTAAKSSDGGKMVDGTNATLLANDSMDLTYSILRDVQVNNIQFFSDFLSLFQLFINYGNYVNLHLCVMIFQLSAETEDVSVTSDEASSVGIEGANSVITHDESLVNGSNNSRLILEFSALKVNKYIFDLWHACCMYKSCAIVASSTAFHNSSEYV